MCATNNKQNTTHVLEVNDCLLACSPRVEKEIKLHATLLEKSVKFALVATVQTG